MRLLNAQQPVFSFRVSPAAAFKALSQSNGLLALGGQGLVSLTNFLTGFIIGRWSSKEQLGLYMLGWTVAMFCSEVCAALVSTPYSIVSPRLADDEGRRYRGSVLTHHCVITSVFVIGCLITATLTHIANRQSALSFVLWSFSIALAPIALRDFIRRLCFAHLKMFDAVLLDACGCVLQLLGLAMIARSGSLTASTAYVLVASTSAIPCAIWLIGKKATFRFDSQSVLTDLRDNWPLGRWIVASGIVWAIAMYLYPWVLTFFHGAAATGIWAACFGVVALGNPVLLGFGNYVGPKIATVHAHHGAAEMRRYVYRSSLTFFGLLLPLVGLLLFTGGRIVSLVYGPSYAGNAFTVSLLSVNLLITAVAFPYSRGLFVLRHAHSDLAVNCITIGLLFTVGLQLVKTHSVNGAAASLLLSNGSTLLVRIVVFERACSKQRGSAEAHVAGIQPLVLARTSTPIA